MKNPTALSPIKKIKVRRILIILCGFFGDALIVISLLEYLRRGFPDSYISCILGSNEISPPEDTLNLFNNNPNVDQCMKADGLILRKMVLLEPYDLAVNLIETKGSNLIVRLSGAKIVISGFKKMPLKKPLEYKYRYFYNGRWSRDIKAGLKKDSSKLEDLLSIARVLGIRRNGIFHPKLYLSKKEEKFGSAYLKKIKNNGNDEVIIMHPGGRLTARLWDFRNYSLLADKLIARFKCKVIISCGPGERKLAERIFRLTENKLIVLEESLRNYLAVISRSDMLISSDGGPLHMALALGIPVIGLFKNKRSLHYWYNPYRMSRLFSPVFVKEKFSPCEVDRVFIKVKDALK